MKKEYCIAYLAGYCEICPESDIDEHCYQIKQNMICDLKKFNEIKTIISEIQLSEDCYKAVRKIKELLVN